MGRMIVVGASLGGVSALIEISSALKKDFPAPILVVLHVGAHRSILPSLLAKDSGMQVAHARHDDPILPGRIYIAPPDQHMLVDGDRIVLSRGAKEHHTRPAIDPLFRSAALAHGPDVIGVVLTGTLDDGTSGLQVIKERGGVAVVQDPEDAFARSMPESALKFVAVDHCVPLPLIPMLLTSLAVATPRPAPQATEEFAAHEQALTLHEGDAMEHLEAIGKPSTFVCPDCHGSLWEMLDSRPIRYRCHTGHGFTARTLQDTLAEAGDEALWNALRALQERELLLRHMAGHDRSHGEELSAARLESAARRLHRQGALLTRLLEKSPEPVE
jgi:two-component system chemotaxis response regulator CheB